LYIPSDSSFANQPTIQQHMFWATDSVVE
jgi:hypothetical protein